MSERQDPATIDCVANTRRIRQKRAGVSAGAARGKEHSGGSEPAGLAEVTELEGLLENLAAAGAPDEVLRVLESATSVQDALTLLAEAGLMPAPEQSLEGLLEGFAPLLEPGCGQLSAELCGTEFLGMLRRAVPAEADLPALLLELIGQAENNGSPQALAMLRVLAVLGPAEARTAAADAAGKLAAAGLADSPWASGLGSPRPGRCFGYADDLGAQRSMAVTFAYGRKRHAIVVLIDEDLGGGVKDCFVTDRPDWLRARYREAGQGFGLEFRDYQGGQAREILDRALARKPCPVEPDQVEDVAEYLDLLRARVELLPEGEAAAPATAPSATAASATAASATAASAIAAAGQGGAGRPPASAAAGQDIHRVKITLRGAKPPIWRRLEVPSGITLQKLHEAILRAFGWTGGHMWVFSTPDGEYGVADRELGFRSAASRKLSDVAPWAGERIRYTYDFGDDWEHVIAVEDVLPAGPGVAYPRCTAGRRACPPEDCGGIWGYQDLLEILADPGSEEHAERLEWLGLESAADLDPAAFDLAAANQALSRMARVLMKR